ncbi:MAG: hypothetical protein HRU20_31115, partial [Pseudomonadales bacterium]|nr:hypothetical protein [Pseudomonadales bacterium]
MRQRIAVFFTMACLAIQASMALGAEPPKLDTGSISLDETWTQVVVDEQYSSMVVVTTPIYGNDMPPAVVRVRSIAANSFEMKLQRLDKITTPLTAIEVNYVVVEEGIYTQQDHGITMEAVKVDSTITDNNSSWKAEAQSYQNTYSNPVVLGQVISSNDENFSIFWSHGGRRTAKPSASNLYVGKHVAEDSNRTRVTEQLGYIVIESGQGIVGDYKIFAAVGADTVKGVADGTGKYNYAVTEIAEPVSAIATLTAMDGNNGGWAVLASPITAGNITLAIDEDQFKDTERKHTSEQVSYLVFEDYIPIEERIDLTLITDLNLKACVETEVNQLGLKRKIDLINLNCNTAVTDLAGLEQFSELQSISVSSSANTASLSALLDLQNLNSVNGIMTAQNGCDEIASLTAIVQSNVDFVNNPSAMNSFIASVPNSCLMPEDYTGPVVAKTVLVDNGFSQCNFDVFDEATQTFRKAIFAAEATDLYCPQGGVEITSLEGLEYFSSLKNVYLSQTVAVDSLEPLLNLSSLERVQGFMNAAHGCDDIAGIAGNVQANAAVSTEPWLLNDFLSEVPNGCVMPEGYTGPLAAKSVLTDSALSQCILNVHDDVTNMMTAAVFAGEATDLNCQGGPEEVSSLVGLEHFTSLERVFFSQATIVDSLSPLANATQLVFVSGVMSASHGCDDLAAIAGSVQANAAVSTEPWLLNEFLSEVPNGCVMPEGYTGPLAAKSVLTDSALSQCILNVHDDVTNMMTAAVFAGEATDLNCQGGPEEVSNLAGLEHFTSLERVFFSQATIVDSLSPLANATQLVFVSGVMSASHGC